LSLESADVESSSDAYARRFSGSVGQWFLDVQARATLELLAPFPGASVLDVGGGHGQLTGPLVDAGHAVTIYGSDPACAARVRTWVDAGRAQFRAGDLMHAPFADQAFDVVVSYRMLPHVRDVAGFLAEIARLARRAVLVDYPTLRSVNALSGATFGMKKQVEGDTRPFRVFRDREVEGALERHAFHRTGRRGQFLLPMALHRALGVASASRVAEGVARAIGLTSALGSPVILRAERRSA
jgi:2-polyprenyl-3-methyl-5-hydroxy-6-metoxy-1,4-benzoquinol methylase